MTPHLRILMVDDSQNDVDLIIANLKKHQISFETQRVQTLDDFIAAFSESQWDIVLCDHSMPALDAPIILKQLQNVEDVPCIIVSGSIGEERAVELVKMGANDFVLKDRLARLGPAVLREISEANERKKRRQLESSLAESQMNLSRLRRFFSPLIADAILSGQADDPFKWHRNDVIVLFVDLRGFTQFAEIAPPQEVMETLQIYYSKIARVAHLNSGSVGHIAGDGIMMIFNDPLPLDRPRDRAIDAALGVRMALSELCSGDGASHSLNFGIGLAEGTATIGGIGEVGCWDYTVVGTVPNLASRLCDIATDGQILVSHRFLGQLDAPFASESLGEIKIRGLQGTVKVYNVLEKSS